MYTQHIKEYANKLTEEKYLEEEQFGFRKGRGCTDATFTMQQIIAQI
jgi:hypothetical protein